MSLQRRGEETRDRILEAAQACFAQHGYDGTGVAEICHRADVTKGGFYHHFPTKQAVFLELVDRWLGGLDSQLGAACADARSVPESLMRMAGMIGQLFQAARGQLPVFLEFWSQAARDQDIWQATIAPYHWYQSFFCGLISAGISEGSLRPVDPEIASQTLVSLAVGLVLQGLIEQEETDWGRVTEESVKLLLEGISTKGGCNELS